MHSRFHDDLDAPVLFLAKRLIHRGRSVQRDSMRDDEGGIDHSSHVAAGDTRRIASSRINFLTLVVSLEAIFLSVFVLMSQNRITRQADKRAHLDLQIDLLAEQELTAMLQMQRAICRKLDIEVDVADERLQGLLEDTDIDKLAARLDKRLPTT